MDLSAFADELNPEEIALLENCEREFSTSPLKHENPKAPSISHSTSDNQFLQSSDIEPPSPNHLKCLKDNFGHYQFKPLQWQVIHSILTRKRDNLAIMSTGYGKSICYQFPAVYLGGITLVISPLISLMEDQVLRLNMSNIPSCFLGSAQTRQSKVISEIMYENMYRIIYLTPEFLMGDNGASLVERMNEKLNIILIAIDEVHCVSQWGNDFRKEYSRLGVIRRELLPNIPILAVTATATPLVQKDIVLSLSLKDPQCVCSGFDRPNLYFSVKVKTGKAIADIQKYLEEVGRKTNIGFNNGSTIIYCIARSETEDISDRLKKLGIKAEAYHAGMPLKLRKEVHGKFIRDELKIIVATIAFGMGIDKPDVRNVIHYGASADVESYYQEVGRAGRDGLPSKCIIFYSYNDFNTRRFLREKSSSSSKILEYKERLFNKFIGYLQTTECRRQYILDYFKGKSSDAWLPKNNCCDNCTQKLNYKIIKAIAPNSNSAYDKTSMYDKPYDFTRETELFLNALDTLRGNYGIGMYILFLRGSKSSKLNPKFYKESLYGAGKDYTEAFWKSFAELLEQAGFITKTTAQHNGYSYTAINISRAGYDLLGGKVYNAKIELKPTLEVIKNMKKPMQPPQPQPSTSNSGASGIAQKKEIKNDPDKENRTMLYEKLLMARDIIKNEKKVDENMIASNVELMQLARHKPLSHEELEKCGFDFFTQEKIKNNWDTFLSLLKFYSQNENIPICPKSIFELLRTYPITTERLKNNALLSYQLFETHKNLKSVAKARKMNETTIENHLISILKVGYPICLSDLKINRNKIDIVKRLLEKLKREGNYKEENAVQLVKNFPVTKYITNFEVSAIITYIRIREHLQALNIPYEDHEPTLEQNYAQKSNDILNCTQAITNLLEIGNSMNKSTEPQIQKETDFKKEIEVDVKVEIDDGSLTNIEDKKNKEFINNEPDEEIKNIFTVSQVKQEIDDESLTDIEEDINFHDLATQPSTALQKRPSDDELNNLNIKKVKLESEIDQFFMENDKNKEELQPVEKPVVTEEDFEGFFDSSPEDLSVVNTSVIQVEVNDDTKSDDEDFSNNCLLDSPPSRDLNTSSISLEEALLETDSIDNETFDELDETIQKLQS